MATAAVRRQRAVDLPNSPLLLTDIVMPGMRGNLLAERLVDLLPTLKVLFMSGYVGSALDVQDWLGKRAAFLQKPFSPDLLARKLRAVLDAEM